METVLTKDDMVRVKLSKDLDGIKIRLFSDWHIGDKYCDLEAVKEAVESVKKDSNTYAICCGDLMNNATRNSVSDVYAEKLSPQEQIGRAIELLEPVKDKILYMCSGNHEARTFRDAGLDPSAVIAANLGISDRYSKNGGLLEIKIGRDRNHTGPKSSVQINYYFYILHGSGGGAKPGAKVNRLVDLAMIVDADVYIHGHTHLPIATMMPFCRINRNHSTVTMEDRLFVNAASKLKYGGYGKEKGLAPQSLVDPVIFLNGKKRAVGCSLCDFIDNIK